MPDWDVRKGEVFPTLTRAIFQALEKHGELEGYKLRILAEEFANEFVQYSSTSVRALLSTLKKYGYIQSRRGRSKAYYSFSKMGSDWWNTHKEENDWGYGEEWNGWMDEMANTSQLLIRLRQSPIKALRLGKLDRTKWQELRLLQRAGKIEIVVRLKKDESQ